MIYTRTIFFVLPNIFIGAKKLDIRFSNLVSRKFVVHRMFDGIHHAVVVVVLESNDPRLVARKFYVSKVASERRATTHRQSCKASCLVFRFTCHSTLHPATPTLNKTVVLHDVIVEDIDDTPCRSIERAKLPQLLRRAFVSAL